MAKYFRDPFIHFLIIGALLFTVYEVINDGTDQEGKLISVTQGQIYSLIAKFEKTWGRPPQSGELKALIDELVLDEIYYRQALALGIDRDDALIRKRLRQKMEFYTEVDSENLHPSEGELQQFFSENADDYRLEDHYSLRQLFLSTNRSEADLERRVEQMKNGLASGELPDADSSLLPSSFSLAGKREIVRHLGLDFYNKLEGLDTNKWIGPIESSMGMHFVFISERLEGGMPELGKIRDSVTKDWRYRRSLEMRERLNERLLAEYAINVEWPVPPES